MKKLGLIPKIVIAIILGFIFGRYLPVSFCRVFVTFSSIFGNFLNFAIPLIIIGFIVAGIADLGSGAGKLLGITILVAYVFTLISGAYAVLAGKLFLPHIINSSELGAMENAKSDLKAFFTMEMTPIMDVTAALILAFIMGLGIAKVQNKTLKDAFIGFQQIVTATIEKVVIPLLPIHICGIFTNMSYTGKASTVFHVFWKVFIIILCLHYSMLLFQFMFGCSCSKKNLIFSLKSQVKGYLTALGTQSSAATIPVNLQCAEQIGTTKGIRDFVIPLCATCHLSGSTITITTCALSVAMLNGMHITMGTIIGFVAMLGVTMVAAPGVPGGAVMASLGLLKANLHFSPSMTGLMIALYIAQDSFGTACNISGDQAVAMVVDSFQKKFSKQHPVDTSSN
ncbi:MULTISPECIES: dicarboxylate/amino acid:cation symporter [Clostridium]|uniref:dicarboxylate/amino acid:cation symporter n=1 Tax=Clostridium TaxID=1485 RepID=UPI0004D7ACA7|nr:MULTISPECIES: dicarboxylate/amino acid:cation symporter [Clostridium]KEH85087.1 sodium:proton antiporter [Clostridium novyi A str. 4540]KEH91471.1 sodium:proton antiporter [Clostridium novyi A str. GD211209]KEH91714.1 sodium:proton antiporter [Clostridium botulinum C/D str. It1]